MVTDSTHNRPLVEKIPAIYVMPGSKVAHQGRTCYARPVGDSTSCPGSQPITYGDITDGTSQTVFVIEVDDEHAVPWTKPQDLAFDPENPAKGLGGHIEGTAYSAFCDGAPHVLQKFITDPRRKDQLKAMFTRNGGVPVGSFD